MSEASTTAATRSTAARAGGYRWLVCALLFFGTTINYVDRQILSLIKEFLDAELGWSNEQFGLVNSAFQGAYAIGLLVFGWFIDRYGTKIGYAVSITAWSAAAIAHSFVGSVSGFFAARVSLGLAEGGNFPAAIKTVALWFPKRERAFATSLFNAGTNVGAILAPALVPAIALTLGWRWAFVLAGLAGFVWLAVWIPLYDVPARRGLTKAEYDLIHSDADEQGRGGRPLGWLGALRIRQTWSVLVAKFITDPVWWFLLVWLPDYFRASRGLNISRSWMHLVAIYAIVTVLSIGGGWFTGFLAGRGWTITRARKTGLFLYALGVVPILFTTRVGDWAAVLLIGLAAGAHQSWSANIFTTISDMFPKKDVATITGLGGTAGAVGGMLFQWFTGWLRDWYGSDANAAYGLLFALCAFAYLVTFAIHHALAPRLVPIVPDEAR